MQRFQGLIAQTDKLVLMAKEFNAQWVILYSAIIIWINVFASHDRGGEEGGNIWNCHGAYIVKKYFVASIGIMRA